MPDAFYDTVRCLIAGDYGDLGARSGNNVQGPTTLTITLDEGPPKDSFFLKLVPDKGGFAGGLPTPGTYTIAGPDADFRTCGLCANIIADIVPMAGPTKFYFATSGTVTLTSVRPPAGSLANLSLVETTVDGEPIAGGCTGSIGAMTFTSM
ncbi:MAG: hypothetical protein KF773_20190 [Deltaproteobacteria bacterium]|nr:hypothetical protein [Deltaproteobacteria bacterium]